MVDTLLATKLHIPVARANMVPRPRLIEYLNAGVAEKLTLISAPAGFGKTSLAREYVLGLDRPVAWISLDEGDNDLIRFFSYLIAALQQIDPAIGHTIQKVLGFPDPPPIQALITALLNDIAVSSTPFVLVLDDYHTIREISIHETIRSLVDRQPPPMHLIITTREDPPLSLARLRAQGQMTEVRARHLRFTAEETATFLNDRMGLALSEDEVATLTARTEGWIAGLQLTALSLREQTDHSAFIRAFTGTDRYVMDYLVDEVLSRQSSEIQAFLLQTSILERLNGRLCDAVIGGRGPGEKGTGNEQADLYRSSGVPSGDSQSILEYLEQANLFVVSLDNQRMWYRYHHLFSDLLRAKLRRIFPDLVLTLHVRAADWCEKHGFIAEAVNHALAARDWERAASRVEQSARELLAHGQMSTVMNWIAALPKEVASSRPRLCIELAWALAYANRLQEVELWLRDAEFALEAGRESQDRQPSAPRETEKRLIQANVALLRAYLALVFGNPSQALALGHLAGELLPGSNLLSSGNAREVLNLHWLFGYAYHNLSDLVRATNSFTEAVRVGKAAGDLWHTMVAMTDLGIAYGQRGQLLRAGDIFREIFQHAARDGVRHHGYLGRVESHLSLVLLEQNILDQALQHAREGVRLTQEWQSSNHVTWAYAVLARVLMAHGDLQGAARALQEADQGRTSATVLPTVASFVEASRVRFWLNQGNLTAAERWADEFRKASGADLCSGQIPDGSMTMKLIALARILMAKGRETNERALFEEALDLLVRLNKAALQGELIHAAIETGTLQSVALSHCETLQARTRPQPSEDATALATLESTLRLAEPEGYMRMFVDEGQPMAELLYEAASCGIAPKYCGRLLTAFPEAEPSRPGSQMLSEEFIEPLSERELEVLQLIAEGFSNREIAQRLYLSLNTVKGHTRNIYAKLSVTSRTQAVARASAIGILLSV